MREGGLGEGRRKREQEEEGRGAEEGRERTQTFSGEEACMSSPSKIQKLISRTISPSCDLLLQVATLAQSPLEPSKTPRAGAAPPAPYPLGRSGRLRWGSLFRFPRAVHALAGLFDRLLLHMAAARGLHAPLHALGGGDTSAERITFSLNGLPRMLVRAAATAVKSPSSFCTVYRNS